ncbi:MAG: hypothetical protein WCH98_17505, partial [Verrucomicrobiota bacterium]
MDWTDSRRETVVAAIASVLLHLALILCVALALTVPAWQYPETSPEQEAPIEVMMLPVEAPKPQEPVYVSTTEQNAPEPPKNAPFESDKNTRAASENAPTGMAPVPTLDGRESPALELVNRDYTKHGEAAAARQQAPE